MNIFAEFTQRVKRVIADLQSDGVLPDGLDVSKVVVEPPRDESHGDLASNAAMVLAKQAGIKPRDLAEKISEGLLQCDDITNVDVAGPGFINLRLSKSIWPKILSEVLAAGSSYGKNNVGQGERINVEYVSVNPTGPLHFGHVRGAVFGDTLARLLAFSGYEVTKEYYINDAGNQVDVLARSAFLRYREALGEEIGEIPSGLYPGDYLKKVGTELQKQHGNSLLEKEESEWLPIVRAKSIEMMLDQIKLDLKELDIHHDVFFSERSLTSGETDRVALAIDVLKEKNAIYQGRLPPPKGKLPDDWEDREQTLFRSTDFGDDVDRALKKSDGTYTYFAADIAYHYDKYIRGFEKQVDVWGADHAGYVKRMKSALKAISDDKAELDVRITQLVNLFRGGEAVKMSKRAGEFITLRHVLDEIGPGPIRFMMLFRKNDAPIEFDFEKVQEHSKSNPVFYVQYANARVHSIFRKVVEQVEGFDLNNNDVELDVLELLEDEGEVFLMKLLSQYPRILEQSAQSYEPHRVAFYLFELASALHAQWNKGKELTQLRFINPEDRILTQARICLTKAVGLVLASGLNILGVEAVTEM